MAKKCEPGCTCGKHKKKGRKCQPGCECGRHKNNHRPCPPGCTCPRHRPRTEEEKLAISRAQIERHRRARELAVGEPTHKRCSKCHEVKPLTEFTFQKRTLVTGEVKSYPKGECLACARERRRQWKAKKTPEERRALNRRYYENQKKTDPEGLRRYKREYAAIKRRREGIAPRGPWKRYREQRGPVVPREPFAEWIEQNYGDNVSRLAQQVGVDESRIRTILNGTYVKDGRAYEVKNVTIDLVDRALLAAGGDTQLWELYPADEE